MKQRHFSNPDDKSPKDNWDDQDGRWLGWCFIGALLTALYLIAIAVKGLIQ